jgi:hypothetical protein
MVVFYPACQKRFYEILYTLNMIPVIRNPCNMDCYWQRELSIPICMSESEFPITMITYCTGDQEIPPLPPGGG